MAVGSLVAVPELQADGPAKVEEEGAGGLLRIRFLASGATMTQERSHVVRYVLLPRTRVVYAARGEKRECRILATRPRRGGAKGLFAYRVAHDDGAEAWLSEGAVIALPPPETPAEQLVTASFHDLRPRFGRAGTPLPPEPWGPATYTARDKLLGYRDRVWSSFGGVVGLAGARIQVLPHQYLAARRVLRDRELRFLLADEVGLGKTIESGLVLQSLLALRPNLRVLVIAPGALVSQWFLELHLKFGGRKFVMVDAERLRTYGSGNLWAEEQLVIASARAVEELGGKQALRFAQAKWDVVIVDECHRMQPGGPLYKRVAMLSKHAPHLLLLSATPGRQHADAYLGLLHLLQPDAYRLDDVRAFESKLAAFDAVAELLAASVAADADWEGLGERWRELLRGDERVAELADLVAEDGEARARLLDHVREHYRLDHRVIAYRREVLARLADETGIGALRMASRSVEFLPYRSERQEEAVRERLRAYARVLFDAIGDDEPPPRLVHWLLQLQLAAAAHPDVLDRLLQMRAAVLEAPEDYEEYRIRAVRGESLAQVLRGDLSEAETTSHIAVSATCHLVDGEGEALAELAKVARNWRRRRSRRVEVLVDRLKEFWREHPREKVLIFTVQSLSVAAIAEALGSHFDDVTVATFGAHQETVEREDAARRFAEDDATCLMVSDPLGGEGRNFQFVSVVADSVQPWSLAAVEQRIGRVDRFGRDGEVPSWVIVPEEESAVDGAWAELLDRAVGAFTRPSSGLEFVAARIEGDAAYAALRDGGPGVRGVIDAAEKLVDEERRRRGEAADDHFADSRATFLAAAREAERMARLRAPIDAVCRWAQGTGGGARRDDDRPFKIRTRASDEGVDGTFDRDLALRREDLAYFAFGHQVVDEMIEHAAESHWCAANAWRRRPASGCAGWEGVRVTFEWRPDLAPVIAAGLDPLVLRHVFATSPALREHHHLRCADGAVEIDDQVLAHLHRPFDAGAGDLALSGERSRDAWCQPFLQGRLDGLDRWQEGIDRTATAAAGLARERAAAAVDEQLPILRRELDRGVAMATGRAAAALERFGRGHPDEERLRAEAEAAKGDAAALLAAVEGGSYAIVGMAYIIVA